MKIQLVHHRILFKLFLAICSIICLDSSVCTAETNEQLQQRILALMTKHQIEPGDDHVVSPNKDIGKVTLNHIEQITQHAMTEQPFHDQNKAGTVYSWANQEDSAEIVLLYLNSQKSAREWAFRILLLTDAGRTQGGKHIRISTSFVGDFSILPEQITDDPHGFAMKDSDKTFIIFVRKNTLIFVDSRRNADPHISVIRIAQDIDVILTGEEKLSQ